MLKIYQKYIRLRKFTGKIRHGDFRIPKERMVCYPNGEKTWSFREELPFMKTKEASLERWGLQTNNSLEIQKIFESGPWDEFPTMQGQSKVNPKCVSQEKSPCPALQGPCQENIGWPSCRIVTFNGRIGWLWVRKQPVKAREKNYPAFSSPRTSHTCQISHLFKLLLLSCLWRRMLGALPNTRHSCQCCSHGLWCRAQFVNRTMVLENSSS